jgi:hypothetical protein
MRRLTGMLTILAASVLLSGSTVMAADTEYGTQIDNQFNKDECLLVSMNCAQEVDSIQVRIERLSKEIAKGIDVYTREELNILQRKLEETYKELGDITSGS